MFERLQKPFLTVETGEAYQPIRLSYQIKQPTELLTVLNDLKCCENSTKQSWNWFWRDECDDLHFESLNSYKRNPEVPLRLGTLMIREGTLYLNLPSFKRACLAVPFFTNKIGTEKAQITKADFINKVFGTDERLPHGFAELFKEDELEKIISTRLRDYEKVQEKIENAASAEEAFSLLAEYSKKENKKRLPYAERYEFEKDVTKSPEITFLSFYIYLRSRELVAIQRWFGETGYTVSDALEEAVQNVFGDMDIDLID